MCLQVRIQGINHLFSKSTECCRHCGGDENVFLVVSLLSEVLGIEYGVLVARPP